MSRLIKAGLAFLIGLAVGKQRRQSLVGPGATGNPVLIACPHFDVPPDRTLVMRPEIAGEETFGDVSVSWFANSVPWECEWEVRRGTSKAPGNRPTASVEFRQIGGAPLAEFGGPGVIVGLSYGSCPQAKRVVGVEVVGTDLVSAGGWDKNSTVYFVAGHFSEYALAIP